MTKQPDELDERFGEAYWSQQSHYSRYSDYVAAAEELRGWFSGLVRLILPHLPDAPARVVDAGCGHGIIVEALRDRGYDALGFDPSTWLIELAQASVPALEDALAIGAIDSIPFEGDFDAITCFEVFEHIEAPVPALETLRDRLRPGGRLIFSTPNIPPHSLWKDPLTSDPTHVSVHDRAWWVETTERAGLRVRHSTTFLPIPLTWRLHRSLGRWISLGPSHGPQVLVVAERV